MSKLNLWRRAIYQRHFKEEGNIVMAPNVHPSSKRRINKLLKKTRFKLAAFIHHNTHKEIENVTLLRSH
jgi:hypothetical protein